MPPVLQGFVFVFGAAIGSFLNAVVWRLRTRENFISGRSHCPSCRHTLSVADLIPVVSWLLLRGRCRYCDSPIAPQYILVEVAVGTLFLLAAIDAFSGSPFIDTARFSGLLLAWYAISVLTVVFLYDLKYMLILRSVTWPAAALLFVGNLLLGMPAWRLGLGMLIGAGFFWLQRVISKGRWVGGGDVHLGALMGAILGFPMILTALFLAYVVGAVVGVALLLRRAAGWKSEVPFGTFLAAATVVSMLWGEAILSWYVGLL